MCEILIIVSNKDSDDVRGHRRGDPIAVMPNDYAWGYGEDKRAHLAKYGNTDDWPNMFIIIQVTDLSVSRGRKILGHATRPAVESDPEYYSDDEADKIVQLHRHKYRLDVASLPSGVKNKLIDEGFAAGTKTQIKPYFKHKITGIEIG